MNALKRFSLLLAFCLACVLVLAGCGKKEPKAEIKGSVSGNTYTNAYLNLKFEAPDGWTFETDAVLAEDSNVSEDDYVNNFVSLANSSQMYDMGAVRNDGTNISIIVQSGKGISRSALKQAVEESASGIEETLRKAGATDVSWEMSDTSIPLDNYVCLEVASIISGIGNLYQKQVYALVDDYACVITVTCVSTNDCDEIFGYFSKLK
ncbi:MAG: hypothetical protein IKZ95_05865 [Lachnospiraceae bacterium]|nr:hypothetical protein [Lachnospiraceae bacterium]